MVNPQNGIMPPSNMPAQTGATTPKRTKTNKKTAKPDQTNTNPNFNLASSSATSRPQPNTDAAKKISNEILSMANSSNSNPKYACLPLTNNNTYNYEYSQLGNQPSSAYSTSQYQQNQPIRYGNPNAGQYQPINQNENSYGYQLNRNQAQSLAASPVQASNKQAASLNQPKAYYSAPSWANGGSSAPYGNSAPDYYAQSANETTSTSSSYYNNASLGAGFGQQTQTNVYSNPGLGNFF